MTLVNTHIASEVARSLSHLERYRTSCLAAQQGTSCGAEAMKFGACAFAVSHPDHHRASRLDSEGTICWAWIDGFN